MFIYFTDHGATGLLAFPNDDLHVKELNHTIHYMYKHKMYQKVTSASGVAAGGGVRVAVFFGRGVFLISLVSRINLFRFWGFGR